MKDILRIIILLNIVLILTACNSEGMSPLLYKDGPKNSASGSSNEDAADITHLDYTINKITLSKNYQSINPGVKIIKDELKSNLYISLGIVESSGIEIRKIEKKDKEVSIYVQNQNLNGEIVVPQALIKLDGFDSKDMEDLNFKIINQNYDPVKANIDIGEAISKIESALKVSTSTFPDVDINKKDDKLFLILDFKNAVDLEQKENPIIDLDVIIDIVDGKMIKSNKKPVSSLIDEGNILEYIPNKYLLYTKEETIKGTEDTSISLWIYDIEKSNKEKIYTSKNKIKSLKFNADQDKLFLIESFSDYNELYLLELKDLRVYKANLDKEINPSVAVWKDNENIVLVDRRDKDSQIFNLNLPSKALSLLSTLKDNISDIKYSKDTYIYTIEDEKNKEIYTTRDFKDKLLIDKGHSPLLIDERTIGYLKDDTIENKTILCFYDLKDKTIHSYSDIDVNNFFIWKNNLGVIENNHIASDNPLYIYNLKSKKIKFVTSVKNEKVFLNSDKNILYINSYINIKEDKTPVISFIDLEP